MEPDFHLYLITDRLQVPDGDLPRAVAHALAGGVRAVQLREKDLSARDLYPLARELRAVTRRAGARLLINDRVDVALAVEADGVHLGGGSLPVKAARHILGPGRLIGVSTHAVAEVQAARADGADFATFGPVFFTPSKAAFGAPVGLERLRAACAGPLPIFALGGVTDERVPDLLAAGAAGVACISAILAAPSPEAAAAAFLARLHDWDRGRV